MTYKTSCLMLSFLNETEAMYTLNMFDTILTGPFYGCHGTNYDIKKPIANRNTLKKRECLFSA